VTDHPECRAIDSLVTPYVDQELTSDERDRVDRHIGVCAPCRSRVSAERATRELIQARKSALCCEQASGALRSRCAALVHRESGPAREPRSTSFAAWRTRLAPFALAASLVLVVVGAFVYQATSRSPRLMAAELTADHVKCFTLNGLLRTHEDPEAVQRAMRSEFGWELVPERLRLVGLELIGSRPCLYGEGKMAHLMYSHEGRPVSIFMLPDAVRPREAFNVLGHEAVIWSVGSRTFVLIAREPRPEVERLATVDQAALK